MRLKTIASGSDGNLHILVDSNGKMLLIEAGVNIKTIKAGCGWDVTNIVGCVVTHHHKDHAASVKNLEKMGIRVCKPYSEDGSHKPVQYGDFRITPFPLDDASHEWVHTNGDSSPCPIYGFLIHHPEMGYMVYLTDCQFCRWTFGRYAPSTILIGIDYQEEYVTEEEAKRNHVYRGHMELKTACDFIEANRTSKLKNVIACHLSRDATEPNEVLTALIEATPDVKNHYLVVPMTEIELEV